MTGQQQHQHHASSSLQQKQEAADVQGRRASLGGGRRGSISGFFGVGGGGGGGTAAAAGDGGGGKLSALKAKLANANRSILNLHGGGGGASPAEANKAAARRMSLASWDGLASSGSSSGAAANYPPGTTVVSDDGAPTTTTTGANDDLLDAPAPPSAAVSSWQPLVPEPPRRAAPPGSTQIPASPAPTVSSTLSSQPSAILSVRSPSNETSVSSVSENANEGPAAAASSTSSGSGPGRAKPNLGKLSMPPPGMPSRKSSIIPQTPAPRPIANLPTLNGSSSSSAGEMMTRQGSSQTVTPTSSMRPRSAGTAVVGSSSGSSRPGSSSSASTGVVGASSATTMMTRSASSGVADGTSSSRSETRWARKAMPVITREPSVRPAVSTSAGAGAHDDEEQESSDEEDESDDDDSMSGSGESDAESGELHQSEGSSLSGVAGRGLLRGAAGRAGRTSDASAISRGGGSSHHRGSISSISEEQDGDEESPAPTSLSERRPDAPRLGTLPSPPRQDRTSSMQWSLATPGAGHQPFSASGWQQFGAPTPGPNDTSSRSVKSPYGSFNMPAGAALAAKLARGETPAAVPSSTAAKTPRASDGKASTGGYFDSAAITTSSDGQATPTPSRPAKTSPATAVPEAGATSPVLETTNPNASLAGALPPFPHSATTPLADPASQAHAFEADSSAQTTASVAAVEATENLDATPEPVLQDESVSTPADAPESPSAEVSRPSLYTRASRSMVDLLSTNDAPEPAERQPVVETTPKRPTHDWAKPPPTPGIGMLQPFKFPASPSAKPETATLQRRRSMDDTLGKLPAYEPPRTGSKFGVPREEEGRERLPEYFCHVHIEGYLPRKMEFSAPGQQSRDRSWKRLYFVLHGTALSVYKQDVHKYPIKDDQHAVPAIDEADIDNLHVHRPGERRISVTKPPEAPGGRRGSLPENTTSQGRSGSVDSITPAPRRGSVASTSTSVSNSSDAKDASLFSGTSSAASSSRRQSITVPAPQPSAATVHAREIAAHLPFHGGNQLIKQYTLQNAESGLAADYVKKRNVVRVRAEGEQFLLQTESSREVVDWIEAFQAATNVSLELDVRPMPKIITLPRRRRRRRPGEPPVPGANAAPGDVAATEDTPEGNARAVAEAERAASGRRSSPPVSAAAGGANSSAVRDMEAMLAEDQAAM